MQRFFNKILGLDPFRGMGVGASAGVRPCADEDGFDPFRGTSVGASAGVRPGGDEHGSGVRPRGPEQQRASAHGRTPADAPTPVPPEGRRVRGGARQLTPLRPFPMNPPRGRRAKFLSFSVVVGLIVTLAIAASGVAFASTPITENTNVTMNVSGAAANVTIDAPSTLTFGTVTLAGSTPAVANPVDANGDPTGFNISIADLTGNAAGWSVTLAATQFTGTANSAHVLPTTALKITGVTPFSVSGVQATNHNPANSVYTTMPIQVTAGGAAAEVYNADVNSGMGSTTLITALALTIPASTYLDTYTSTITVAVGDHLTA